MYLQHLVYVLDVFVLRPNAIHTAVKYSVRQLWHHFVLAAAVMELKKNERKINEKLVLMNNVIKRYSLSFAIRIFMQQNEKITFCLCVTI